MIISLVVAGTGIITVVLGYKKDKTENPQATAILSKRIFILALIVAVLNSIVPLIKHFKPSPTPPATTAEVEALFKQYIGEKPKNPPVEVVKTEIEKEFSAAFG